VDESPTPSTVTPQGYTYKQVYDRLNEATVEKAKEEVRVRTANILEASLPSAEAKTKNMSVLETKIWMKDSVQQTILESLDFNALGEALKKHITETFGRSYCETNERERCAGTNKSQLVNGTPNEGRETVCYETMQEWVQGQIVDAIDSDEMEAEALRIMFKQKERGNGVTNMVVEE
jgi:hypothetical protein